MHDYTSLSDSELDARDDAIASRLVNGDSVGGALLGTHLCYLANTAFSTGRAHAVTLLQRWAMSPPTADPLHQAWAVWSLLASGFWGTAQRVLLDLLRTREGRGVLRRLVAGTEINPVGTGFMMLDMPEAKRVECWKVLSGQYPWADPVQVVEPMLREYIQALRTKTHGGWD